MTNTKDFKNNLLLIEFWSSWCVPCRESNPKLVKIYDAYNDKGFDIFGVSLDPREGPRMSATAKDGLGWTNTIAKEGFKSDVVKALRVQYIPSNFLINQKGEIIAINIEPEELEEKLKAFY